MKKRVLSLLLVLAILLMLSPSVSAEELKGSCGAGVNWRFDTETGVFRVSGNGPMKDFVNGETPWKSINSQIKTAVIEPGVTNLGDYTFFYCSNLESVSLPDGLTRIGACGFYECPKLEKLELPDTVETIVGISRTGIRRLVLPANLKTITDGALSYNTNLQSVVFNEGLQTIGSGAFVGCSSLTSAYLPDTVTSIGSYAFQYCYGLKGLELSAGMSTISPGLCERCENLEYVVFPDSIKNIEYNAFLGCSKLKQVKLNEGLEVVGQGAFANTAIEHLILPESMTYVAADAFNVSSLRKVAVLSKTCEYFTHPWNNNLGDPARVEVYGYVDSTTQTYAVEKNYYFEILDPDNLWEDTVAPKPVEKPFSWVDNSFTDVSEDSFYYVPVLWALDNDITTGTSADKFGSNGSCLRAQVVTFLHRAADKPQSNSTNNPFTDVKSGDFSYQPVLWAVEKGITNGTSATTFGAYANCNRAAVVTFLWRAAGEPAPESTENPFVDVKTTDFFYKPVLWAIEEGITNGVDATHFGPATDCNRAQVVTFLYRAYN